MSGGASWRVALRIARRDARRAKARTALIAVLIALPVAGAAAADVMWRSTQLDPQDVATIELGAAQAKVLDEIHGVPVAQNPVGTSTMESGDAKPDWVPPTPDQRRALLAPLLPVGDRLVETHQWWPSWRLRVGDVARWVTVLDDPYASPELAGRVQQVSGREPRTADEIAVDTVLAGSTGLSAGDRVDLPGAVGASPRPVTVVGVVRFPGSSSGMIYVTADALAAMSTPEQRQTRFYVAGPTPLTWDDVKRINQTGQVVLSRAVLLDPPADDQLDPAMTTDAPTVDASAVATAAVVVGLVLLQVVLMAGPALAVGARRQQRTLALLAAGGGRRRDLRRLVLGNGFVAGLVAGLVAGVVGVGLGTLAGSVGGIVADRRGWAPIPRIDLRPLELGGLVVVGIVTAVLAAAVPARQASRTDVVVALTGRFGGRSARGRTTVLGGVLAAAGAVLAIGGAAHGSSLGTVAGIAVAEIGLIFMVGTVVALAARLAARAPLSTRMAMRDAQRHRSRTVPAVAAIMAAVAGGVAALMVTATQHSRDVASWRYTAAPGTAIIIGRALPQVADPKQGLPAAPASDPKHLESLLRSTLPISGPAGRLGSAFTKTGGWISVTLRRPDSCELTQGSWCDMSDDRLRVGDNGPLLADPAGLGVYLNETGPVLDAAAAALARGEVVVGDPRDLNPDGTVTIQTTVPPERDGDREVKAEHRLRAHLWTGRYAPTYPVLGEKAVRTLGFTPGFDKVAAATSGDVGSRQLARAQTAAEDESDPLTVQVEQGAPGVDLLIVVLLAIALGVAAVGTFSAVGLAVAEGRADLSTLAAVGASPRTRRLHAAGQAFVVSGLGSVLGLLGGLVAGYAICRLQLPWVDGGPHSPGWFTTQGTSEIHGVWTITVPWPAVVACVVGLPLVTSLITGLVLRSRLVLVRRLGQ